MDMDSSKIRLLILEDSEDDALLLIRHLTKSFVSLAYVICDTLEAFVFELDTHEYDAIISDYNLNGFTAIDAFELYRKMDLDIPFIIVSGQIGEDLAVEAMKTGVHDYLMKDRLGRLVPSLKKELLEVQKRKEQKATQAALEFEQTKFHLLVEGAPIGIAIVSENGTIEYANSMSEKIFGYKSGEIKTLPDFIAKIFPNEEDCALVLKYWMESFNPKENLPDMEFPMIKCKDGSPKFVKIKSAPISNHSFIVMAEDITSQRISAISLEKSQKRLMQIFNSVKDIVIELEPENQDFVITAVNNAFSIATGIAAHNIINQTIDKVFEEQTVMQASINEARKGQKSINCECDFTFPNGVRHWDNFIAPLFTEDGTLYRIIITARDVTERKQQEIKLLNSEKKFRIISTVVSDAIWEYSVEDGYIEWNDGLKSLFGYELDEIEPTIDWVKSKIHPMDINFTASALFTALKSEDEFWSTEFQFKCKDGSFKHVNSMAYILYDSDKNPVRVIGAMIDLTHRLKIEELRIQSLVDGAENERKMIAGELHDNLGQNLSLVSILLEQIYALNHDKTIEKATKLVHQSIDDIRQLAHSLLPKTIQDFGIKAAILSLLNNTKLTHSYQINTHFNFENERFSPKIETNLYRIVQEAINNIIKHAEAKTIFIQMIYGDSNLSLTIEDDGIGFEFDKIKLREGIGLKNIENRVYYLNGKLTIESNPGKGTLILVDVRV
jgi:PAS domain S-box-containing protein